MKLRPRHILIPVTLSFLAAALNGIGLGLFIPIAKGIAQNDFTVVYDTPVLGKGITMLAEMLDISSVSGNTILSSVIVLIVLVNIVRIFMVYLGRVYTEYWSGVFYKRVSSSIYKRFLSFGKLFFDRSSQGELQTTLNFVQHILMMMRVVNAIANAAFQVVFRLIVMVIISWPLTIMAALTMPVLYCFIKLKAKTIKKYSRLRTKMHLEIGRETFNILSGITLVKNYAKEDAMQERFNELHEEYRSYDFRAKSVAALAEPVQELIILVAFVIIMLVGSMYATELSLENISLLLIFLFTAKGAMPFFAELGKAGMYVADMSGPLSNIVRVYDDKDKHAIPSGSTVFKGLEGNIEYKNVNFSYVQETPVLNNFTLTIEKNSTVALVGPSGGGKTTTASLLLRLYDCEPNSIFINGTDIREFSLESLQQKIAYVSQESIFFNDTLRMNLLFGLEEEASDDVIKDAVTKARLDDFVESLPEGLDSIIGDRGVQLSGGQKQRLSIARALLKKAEVFILDEATSSLDSETEKKIQEAVDEAVADRTAIVIAHRLSTIKNADKIVVIRDGCVAEVGPMEELLEKKGLFHKLWEAQQFF